MKTKLFLLLAALSFSAVSLIAQEPKTMYIMKNGEVAYQSAVSEVDSIIFYKSTPVIPEGGVLINGVVWATCNVAAPGTFAANPEDAGMFYQWNRNIGWSVTNPMTNSNGGTIWDNSFPSGDSWAKSNDPSPSGWRVPTREEQQTLLDTDKVTSEWTTLNGVTGKKFTDKATGASFFLPAAGRRSLNDGTLLSNGSSCYYWSRTQSDSFNAYSLYFFSSNANVFSYGRNFGKSVRAVAE